MSKHRSNAQFVRANWRLRILAPFWILQLGLTLALTGLFAWRLGDTIKNYDARDKAGKTPVIEFVWEGTNVAMSFTATICTITEIGKYLAESLTPWTMLFTHVVKLACASAILALDILIYIKHNESHYSLISLGLDAALTATTVGLAVYSIVTYRRLSSLDDYARPVNVKAFGYGDEREIYDSRRLSVRNSFDGRVSWGTPRLSLSSARNEPITLETLERTASTYSHERDTQFEKYMSKRGSWQGSLEAEMAAGGGYSPPNELKNVPAVTVGTVTTRARGQSINRATSYGSEQALVSVPEEEASMLDSHASEQELFIGHGRTDSLDRPVEPQVVDISQPKWQQHQ